MLQVPLAPAAVALGMVNDVFGGFFIAALQVIIDPHGPARAGQQGGLDIVMAQDMATEGRLARQFRQGAAFGKGAHADDGVMPPERPGAALHHRKAPREDRRIEGSGELHGPAKARPCPDHHGQGLQQAKVGHSLDPAHHLDHGVAFHQAVGVKDDGVVIGRPGAADEVFDVPRLAAFVVGAAAIEHPAFAMGVGQKAQEPDAFARGDIIIAGV